MKIAIAGRPNTGKSTLFNALVGERISIVKDYPGVTRDRIYADVTWLNHVFTLIDTGGVEMDTKDVMFSHMREQVEIAIDTADVILFLVDVRQGLMDADHKVADLLRKANKPILLVVNKVDNFDKFMTDVYEFYALGLGEPSPISSSSKLGFGDMLERLMELINPNEAEEEEEDDRAKVAIVGKPNVGKSSIVNRLLGENRLIVSDIAGTTRDAIDTNVKWNGKEFIFIDTAGLRRKSKIKEELERFSIIRAVAAVERADVVVLVIDGEEGVTEQDAKIAGIAHDRGKGMIIAVNKWDVVEKDNQTVNNYTKKIKEVLSFIPYAQILFMSALTGQRIHRLFQMLEVVIQNHALRISTGVINEIVMEAVALQQPPSDKGKRLKVYYMTQVSVKPPTFVAFVNKKELMHFSYLRYLENKLREAFGFAGTPIRIFVRERKGRE
jgi:GTP-binding protein